MGHGPCTTQSLCAQSPEIKLKLMSITLTLAIVMTQKQLPPLSSCVYNVNVL